MTLIMTGAAPDELWPLIREYHYSRRMPAAVSHAFAWRRPGGLFGDTGQPVAGILFGKPVNRNWPQDALELARLVRTPELDRPLTTFVGWALRWLRANTSRPFVLSYADSSQGHYGGIYQAAGFVYVGTSPRDNIGFLAEDGSFIHARNCNAKFGTRSMARIAELRPGWQPVQGEAKHIYIRPLRQRLHSIFARTELKSIKYPKPNAAGPVDERPPSRASLVQPEAAAPSPPKDGGKE